MPRDASTLEAFTHSMSQSSIEPDASESETSADELFQDVSQGSGLFHKRLKKESEKHSFNPVLKIRLKKSYSEANSRSRSRG